MLERKSGNISETRKDIGTVTKGLGVANPQSWGRGGRRGSALVPNSNGVWECLPDVCPVSVNFRTDRLRNFCAVGSNFPFSAIDN